MVNMKNTQYSNPARRRDIRQIYLKDIDMKNVRLGDYSLDLNVEIAEDLFLKIGQIITIDQQIEEQRYEYSIGEYTDICLDSFKTRSSVNGLNAQMLYDGFYDKIEIAIEAEFDKIIGGTYGKYSSKNFFTRRGIS